MYCLYTNDLILAAPTDEREEVICDMKSTGLNHTVEGLQAASADICDECFVFANQVWYRHHLTGKEDFKALNNDMEDNGIPEEAIKVNKGDALKADAIILGGTEHANKQQKQRALFQLVKQQARNQNVQGTCVQIHTFMADFSQNMGVPNLAGEQPGNAYYLSPLSAFVFGVVDCSNKKTSLAAHTYFETDGKKALNNFASMLWNELTRKGLTMPGGMKEINFVMDYCVWGRTKTGWYCDCSSCWSS
jgi:hypothetical protein